MKSHPGEESIRSQHVPEIGEISLEHILDTNLVVTMRLLEEAEITLEAIFALDSLDSGLHPIEIGGQLER